MMSLPVGARLLAVAGWLVLGYRSRRRFQAERLRVYANGDVHLRLMDGRWFDGRVAPGSLFLRHVAWLRVEGSRPYRGWFVANDAACDEWRRLRVIARHFADI